MSYIPKDYQKDAMPYGYTRSAILYARWLYLHSPVSKMLREEAEKKD